MTIDTRLAEIRARVENAASFRDERGVPTLTGFSIPDLSNVIRADLPALLAAVEAVLDLHVADEDGDCAECIRRAQGRGDQSYPCLTVTALTAALEVQG